MNLLPEKTYLGKLNIQEIFVYYDIPLLFTCISESGQVYLVVSIDDETISHTWLYSPIDNDTVHQLRKASIDVRSAFLRAKDEFLFMVKIKKEGEPEVYPYHVESINEDWLPVEGQTIEPTTEEQIIPYTSDAKHVAQLTHKAVINLVLHSPSIIDNEAPARFVGNILTFLQELIDSLGFEISGKYKERGPIPSDVLEKTEMYVSHAFNGSFGIQLRSALKDDSPVYNIFHLSLHKYFKLLNVQSTEELKDMLPKIYHRSINKYYNFLKALDDSSTSLYLESFSIRDKRKECIHIDNQKVKEYRSIIDDTEAETEENIIRGRLTGIVLRTKRFEIVDMDTNDPPYKGQITDNAYSSASSAQMNQIYLATLIKQKTTYKSTQETKTIWYLNELNSDDERS